MAKITIKATVEKIVVQNGKKDAQVVITVPVNSVTDIPTGAVSVTIETLQSALFGPNSESKKSKKSK